MKFKLALVLAAVALAPSMSYGNEHQDCHHDAMRFCSHEIPNIDRITSCMEHNVKHLSPACRRHFGPVHHKHKL